MSRRTGLSEEEIKERMQVPFNVRKLKEQLPTDDWLAIYALYNYMDMHSESIRFHLTSAKKTRTFVTSLLAELLTDTGFREDFVGMGGMVDLRVDGEGKVFPREMESDDAVTIEEGTE